MPFLLVLAGLALPASGLFAQTPLVPVAPVAPTPAAPPETQPLPEHIQVQELAVVNPNEAGLIDEAHGALGASMWSGTALGTIRGGLALLPNQPGWRSLRALELRLLESPATLPEGKQGGEPALALRAGKLLAIGAPEAAAQLLARMPGPQMTPTLRRLQVDALLLGGDVKGACGQEANLRAALPGDNYATQVQVFCQYIGGRGNEAGLGVDLLRDQKLKDPVFFAAADSLGGLPPAKIDWVGQASPVSTAMAIQAKLPVPETAVASASPMVLSALARGETLPPEIRIAATERAVALGILPAEALRTLYDSAQIDTGTASGETGKTAKSRIILYKAAQAQPVPNLRAELIQRALAGDPATAPLVYAPMLAQLQASPDLVNFAPWAVRALLASGQYEATRPWFGILRAEGVVSGGTMAAALKPLARLAGQTEALTSADLAAWRQARGESPADAAKRSLLLFSLTSALGDTPPETDWLPLLDGPTVITGKVSRSALSVGLLSAATAQHRGETVLYVLLALGEARDAEPAEFARLIAALKAVGLEADARALALELALAYGI